MTKEEFNKRFGEDPVDVLGEDWENYIEEYLEEINKTEVIKKLTELGLVK